MPPLVLSTNDSVHTNSVTLSDAPAVWMTGDRIRFINSESGRAIASTTGAPAIRMAGADGVVINEAGGVIRFATSSLTQVVIEGSAGADRVENAGVIIGRVALGGGTDTYVSRVTTNDFATLTELGAGDDFFYVRPSTSVSVAPRVDGGDGEDRYVIFESDGNVDGPQVTNVEILDLRTNGFIESFSGLETIVVDFRPAGRFFTGLRFFNTPDAEVQILATGGNTSLSVYDRSVIGGLTGSEFSDSLDLGSDTLVSGVIDFGGGDDFMIIRLSQFENPRQESFGEAIDGGDGTDSLSLYLQGGDVFDAENIVNFESLRVSTSTLTSTPLIVRNVDHVPLLIVGQFPTGPVRLEEADLSGGSIHMEPTGSLIIAADSVVGLVKSLTPFPIDTVVADDTKSISIVNQGQILGDVLMYIGDDLLDSRTGTVGGHILGYAGNDTILTDAGDNWLDGGAGADYLSSGAGNDVLVGGSAADTLIGGAGIDQMSGGTGNDTYFVDNAGDTVTEAVGEGYDVVAAGLTYVLGAGVEIELLTTGFIGGTAAIDFTGNELANQIWGNDGANILNGAGGNDALFGFGGNDMLIGGTGNDTMFIDSAGDTIVEAAGEGYDVVAAGLSYTLGAGVEIELVTTGFIGGMVTIDFTGNEFANQIWGNGAGNILGGGGGNDALFGFGGNDILVGGIGADLLAGGTGNDSMFVDDAGDIALEAVGEGYDIVAAGVTYALIAGSEIELLTTGFIAGTAAINFTGNELANQIWGNDGAN
ncbi:MAG TPA: calcium-binding protein, partial [Allosphingosinicella sp.]